MPITSFKQLAIWQRSFALANRFYRLSSGWPNEHRYGLTSQLLKSAVSVPSNIAEGYNRKSRKEYLYFLNVAMGSLAELETQAMIATEQQFIKDCDAACILQEIDEIGKMLRTVMHKLTHTSPAQ